MSAGHHHGHGVGDADVRVSRTARIATLALLAVVAAVTIAGLVWLWPTEGTPSRGSVLTAEGIVPVRGQIVAIGPCPPTGIEAEPNEGVMHACLVAQVELDGRPGQVVDVELIGVTARSGLEPGDGVHIAEIPGAEDSPGGWALITVDRIPVLAIFTVLFVVAVLAVAGRKGFFGLLGLVVSGVVLFGFMIPALTSGKPAVWVAMVGSTAIMFVVLYLAHGISWRTTSAFVGTWLSLIVTTGLGAAGVSAARLSGMSSEETLSLAGTLSYLDFPDILTCGLVIAGLGVLNDVTITQASSVWEVRSAGPHLTRGQLFASGMRIGRDHIASTIYTIVFAYAGAALSLLLLLSLYEQPLHLLLSTEQFSEEIIRTLGSGIGLVLSVPLTTGVAALTVAGASAIGGGADAIPEETKPTPVGPRRAI